MVQAFHQEHKNMFICGDFNDEPESEAVLEMRKTFESASRHIHEGKEPEFTTVKFRESHGMCSRVIDYVFFRGVEGIKGGLKMPASDKIDHHMGNPCKDHPSDHYALCFDVKLMQ
jgi:endonuclease/exonuclease/phosphatase (EEP) superfamily protein YafD